MKKDRFVPDIKAKQDDMFVNMIRMEREIKQDKEIQKLKDIIRKQNEIISSLV